MINPAVQFKVGQRVRIIEEEEPPIHIGKLAIIKEVETPENGEITCVLQVDRFAEPVSLPQRFLKPIITMPSSLLANDLFLPWDTDNPNIRFQQYTGDRWIAGRVMESLLYYDRIVVPTVDFSVIVPLVHWLGLGLFKELLASEALSFIRYTGSLGYSGNGVGLVLFEIQPGKKPEKEEKPKDWWIRSARCLPHEAVILQLENRLKGLGKGVIDRAGKLVELCTVDTRLPEFTEKVENETYRDILGSQILSTYFSIRNSNLKHLTGINPNDIRVFTRLPKPAVAGDEIDITLRLAMLNLETYLAEEAGTRDMVTDRGFSPLLEAKIHRYSGGKIAKDSFSNLITIEQLPDLVSSIRDGRLDSAKVWQFRNTKNACQFRQWFDEIGPIDPTKCTQEYVKMLHDGGLWSSGKAKLVRFIVINAIGTALMPITGGYSFIASLGISAVDSFLLDKIRFGYNPRYFIDELRHHFFTKK